MGKEHLKNDSLLIVYEVLHCHSKTMIILIPNLAYTDHIKKFR